MWVTHISIASYELWARRLASKLSDWRPLKFFVTTGKNAKNGWLASVAKNQLIFEIDQLFFHHHHRRHRHHHHHHWALAGLRPEGPSGIVGRVNFSRVHFSCLRSRLRRSARSAIMTWGNDKTPWTFQLSNLPTSLPSSLPTFYSNLLTF